MIQITKGDMETILCIISVIYAIALIYKLVKFYSKRGKSGNRYLCHQHKLIGEDTVDGRKVVNIELTIRNVGAKNAEEAIGKFVKEMETMDGSNIDSPTCFPLDMLRKID